MPIFSFRCESCQKSYDQYTAYHSLTSIRCPKCNGYADKDLAVPARPVVKGGTPIFHDTQSEN